LALDNYKHRLVLAAAVALLCLVPLSAARVVAVFLAAGVLPGLAVASRSRFRLAESIGLGTAISPVLFGACVLLAMWIGAGAGAAAWMAFGTSLVTFVCAYRSMPSNQGEPSSASTEHHGPSSSASTERRALGGVALLVAIAAIMAFALPLTDFWWRTRDDSWFHAAVTSKLLRDGLPVADPYFAGLRLQYMYFYHAILAACSSLARIDAFHAMILVNGIALVSCTSAFHALAGLFSRRVAPRVLGTALWLFGMNGWFYLFYVTRIARALSGETHGFARFFPWSPNGHATAMSLISVEGNQFMFLDKFMLGTAFALTFSLAASVLCLLLSARRGAWSTRHDAVLFFSIAGAMLLHPVTGITLAVVTGAVLALLLLVRSQTARGGPSYTRLVGWMAAGIAVTLPYIRSVMARGERGEAAAGFAIQPGVALGLLADILPALVLAVWFFRRAGDDKDTSERFGAAPFTELTLSGSGLLALWFVFMLIVGLTVDLTTNNETKFSYFLWLPLCAFAVGCFERTRNRAALAIVASAALPLHLLYFHHAVRDQSALVVTDQERAVYQWIEASLPDDAVFIERDDIVRVPVLANRDIYWGTETYARNWGYPAAEMAARRDLRDRVFSDAGPGADDVMQLRVLGRRVFVIYRINFDSVEDDFISAPERFEGSPHLRGKFATTEVAVWEMILD
jgi:hypothetical protein